MELKIFGTGMCFLTMHNESLHILMPGPSEPSMEEVKDHDAAIIFNENQWSFNGTADPHPGTPHRPYKYWFLKNDLVKLEVTNPDLNNLVIDTSPNNNLFPMTIDDEKKWKWICPFIGKDESGDPAKPILKNGLLNPMGHQNANKLLNASIEIKQGTLEPGAFGYHRLPAHFDWHGNRQIFASSFIVSLSVDTAKFVSKKFDNSSVTFNLETNGPGEREVWLVNLEKDVIKSGSIEPQGRLEAGILNHEYTYMKRLFTNPHPSTPRSIGGIRAQHANRMKRLINRRRQRCTDEFMRNKFFPHLNGDSPRSHPCAPFTDI